MNLHHSVLYLTYWGATPKNLVELVEPFRMSNIAFMLHTNLARELVEISRTFV